MIEYVNACDRFYAQEQMEKWRQWKSNRSQKLRGSVSNAPQLDAPKPSITLTCSSCNKEYTLLESSNKTRLKKNKPPMCKRCIGIMGANIQHSPK